MPSKIEKERLLNDVATWQADGLISADTCAVLRGRWSAPGFGLATAAKYLGVAGATLAGVGLLGMIAAFTGSEALGGIMTLGVAAGLLFAGLRLASDPAGTYLHSSKVVLVLAVLALNGGLALVADSLGADGESIPVLVGLFSLPVTFFLAYRHRNILIVILGLLLFFHWVGSFTSMLGRSTYAIGIEDPRLMALFALAVFGVGIYHERQLAARCGRFYQAYQAVSLTYLNLSLLILTIYPRGTALVFIIVWAAAGIAQIVVGAWLDNPLLVGFGVTAVGINLFTRYHEHFWEEIDAGLFFVIGGGALFAVAAGLEWLLRRRSERRP